MNVKCLAVALLCTAVFGFVSAAPVKVVNPGLEEGAKGWRLAGRPDWSVAENVGRGGGRGLLRSGSVTSSYQVVGLPLDLKPGHRYRVSVWAKSIDLTDGKRPGVCVEWNDRWKGGYLGGVGPTRRSVSEPDAEGWRKYEMDTWMIPANAVGCALHLFAPKLTGGRCVYDDVTVEEIGVAAQELTSSAAFNRAATGKVQFLIRTYPDFGVCPYEDLEPVFTYQTEQGPRTVRSREFRDGVASTVVDVSELKMGTHPVTFSIGVRGKGTLSSWKLDFTRLRPEEAKPGRVHFDAHQRLIVDGKPFFPLGMYNSHIYATNLEVYARSPFNVIGPYETWSREKLDMLEAKGIKAIYSVAPGHDAGSERDLARLRKLVTEVRDHPAVIAWYMTDEPILQLVPTLEKRRAIVEALDGDHPTWGVQCSFGDMRHFNGAYDILGVDPYPVGRNGGSRDVGRMIEAAREGVSSGFGCLAQWHVPQAFAWGWLKRKEWEGYRAPTTREMANMTWQAIAGGANGIVYYSFGYYAQPHEDPDDDQKSAFARVCAAASEVRQYERVLLFGDEPPEVETSDPRIAARVYRQGGETYLLVVNASDAARKGTVTVKDRFARVGVTDFGSAPVLTDGGTFAVDLAPMGYFMSRLER